MKQYQILLVEDEKPLAQSLKIKLEQAGFTVVLAHNGHEGLGFMDQRTFDLILLDLVMPVMDGFEMLEELKRRKNKIPVIVTTNLSQGKDLQRAKSLGATDYTVKVDTPLRVIVERIREELAAGGE